MYLFPHPESYATCKPNEDIFEELEANNDSMNLTVVNAGYVNFK